MRTSFPSHIGALLSSLPETLVQRTLVSVQGSLDPTHWPNSFFSCQARVTIYNLFMTYEKQI